MDAPRNEHDEHAVAAGKRLLDDLAVVRRSRDDRDAPRERFELPDALLAAHADHVVPAVEAVRDRRRAERALGNPAHAGDRAS